MYDHQYSATDTFEPQTPSREEIKGQLDRMLQCRLFKHSPRLSRFFTFTVEQALEGAEQRLKEYSIALEVFGKPETFDPRMDSAVRVAARQLRAKIDLYYLTEGAQDPVLIRYRPGDYIPKFYHRTDGPVLGTLEQDSDSVVRPAIIVEKDRGAIRILTDALDSMSYPIAQVLDCGERCIESLHTVGSCVVLTGVNLMGSLNGPSLARLLRSRADVAVVTLIPAAAESSIVEQVAMSDPDAVVYEPVRAADLKSAIRLAIARSQFRHAGASERTEPQPELAEV
jgi:FixJ family two-component response regulator